MVKIFLDNLNFSLLVTSKLRTHGGRVSQNYVG